MLAPWCIYLLLVLFAAALLILLLGGLLIMAGWPAAYLRYRVESGVLGLAGAAAVFLAGMSLTVGWSTVQALVFSWMPPRTSQTRPSTPDGCPSPSSSQWPAPSS